MLGTCRHCSVARTHIPEIEPDWNGLKYPSSTVPDERPGLVGDVNVVKVL